MPRSPGRSGRRVLAVAAGTVIGGMVGALLGRADAWWSPTLNYWMFGGLAVGAWLGAILVVSRRARFVVLMVLSIFGPVAVVALVWRGSRVSRFANEFLYWPGWPLSDLVWHLLAGGFVVCGAVALFLAALRGLRRDDPEGDGEPPDDRG